MLNFNDVLNLYLQEDGLSRDIVKDLANPMGFNIHQGMNRFPKDVSHDFFAITVISKDKKDIYINIAKTLDVEEIKFVLAYQLAEVIKNNIDGEYSSSFSLCSIDIEVYELARKIYDRRTNKMVKKKNK